MSEVAHLRGSIRAILYENNKYALGCPKEENCHLYRDYGGEKACELCPKHLKVVTPALDPEYAPRISYLVRIESMINVGCHFGPDDLPPDTWDHLIVLAQERDWMDRKIREQQKDSDKEHPGLSSEAQGKIEQARKEMGIPAPGKSIFD